MSSQELLATAQAMVAPGKGLLAMDESNDTCNRRFTQLGIETTVENRRAYRSLIVTTPGLGDYISGAILYDETIRQSLEDGRSFVQALLDAGIIPGIKLDMGAKPLAKHPNEKVTEGLDGLRDRIAEYYNMGARFAKWRAVITIGEGDKQPSQASIEANAHALARYAALCQEGGLVPIVEPEVLMDGEHYLDTCYEATATILKETFRQLDHQGVVLEQMVLKPNMVISGKHCPNQANIEQVAGATVYCLRRTVPAAVPGIAFLSGGQSSELAAAHLNAMHVQYGDQLPWRLTFSYSRAIQQPALEAWKGDPANVPQAQQLLLHWAKCDSAASQGKYTAEMGKQVDAAIGNTKPLQLLSQD